MTPELKGYGSTYASLKQRDELNPYRVIDADEVIAMNQMQLKLYGEGAKLPPEISHKIWRAGEGAVLRDVLDADEMKTFLDVRQRNLTPKSFVEVVHGKDGAANYDAFATDVASFAGSLRARFTQQSNERMAVLGATNSTLMKSRERIVDEINTAKGKIGDSSHYSPAQLAATEQKLWDDLLKARGITDQLNNNSSEINSLREGLRLTQTAAESKSQNAGNFVGRLVDSNDFVGSPHEKAFAEYTVAVDKYLKMNGFPPANRAGQVIPGSFDDLLAQEVRGGGSAPNSSLPFDQLLQNEFNPNRRTGLEPVADHLN